MVMGPNQKGANIMAIRAGVGLPGPFFITFPIGGPIIGLIAIMVLPMIWMFQLMFYMCWGMGWLAWQLIKAIAPPAKQAVKSGSRQVQAQYRQSKPRAALPAPDPTLAKLLSLHSFRAGRPLTEVEIVRITNVYNGQEWK